MKMSHRFLVNRKQKLRIPNIHNDRWRIFFLPHLSIAYPIKGRDNKVPNPERPKIIPIVAESAMKWSDNHRGITAIDNPKHVANRMSIKKMNTKFFVKSLGFLSLSMMLLISRHILRCAYFL
jgi:hypothetical protein